MRSLFLKRLFDIVISSWGIILTLPLWFVISIMILLDDGCPIYYLQSRVGKNGRIFSLIKFRSMVPHAEEGMGPVQATENDPRITRVGRFLRETAMDELPQLLNILKGDMSFVGPRALRPQEIENKTKIVTDLINNPSARIRHSVVPGLTGPAQVFAACDIPTTEKLKYDRWYIRYSGFSLDLWLILVSFLITFKGKWESRDKKLKFLDLGYFGKKGNY